jgi:hypothetical protein
MTKNLFIPIKTKLPQFVLLLLINGTPHAMIFYLYCQIPKNASVEMTKCVLTRSNQE